MHMYALQCVSFISFDWEILSMTNYAYRNDVHASFTDTTALNIELGDLGQDLELGSKRLKKGPDRPDKQKTQPLYQIGRR